MRLKLASLTAVAVLLLAGAGWADSQARIVRLSYLEGDVQLDRGDGNGYARAFLNMPLIEGTSVWAKSDARAEVEFEDGSTLRLAPDSIVRFAELRLRADGSKATGVELRDGTAYFDVKQHDDDSFRVNVGAREITLKKSSEFRVIHALAQDSDLRVAVFKGELRFLDRNGQLIPVKKNETLSLVFDESGRYFLARGIAEEPHDYWNQEREKDRKVLAARERDNIYAADLYRYGTFFTVSGYGQLWRPASVGIGWDPFGSGSWVYYPGMGFVWVSDYIWGWTPYRYGSWLYVNNHGWCWRPEGYRRPWISQPVVINPPSGYVKPVPPSSPRTPIIRVGRSYDAPVFTDERRKGDSPVLVEDRVRGLRQAEAPMPARRWSPAPVGGDSTGSRDRRMGDDPNGGRPVEPRADTIIRPQPRPNDGKRQRDLGIDAQREHDEPIRTSPRPTPAPAPVQPVIQDRPMRTPRNQTPSPPPARMPERPPQMAPTPPPRMPPPAQRPAKSAPGVDNIKVQ